MEGLCVPGVTRAAVVAILYCRCDVLIPDPVQVLLHVVCHCEDDQLSVLSPCSAVLGVSQYGHCNLLPWPHLQSNEDLLSYLDFYYLYLKDWVLKKGCFFFC
jgi:hypothetical protein